MLEIKKVSYINEIVAINVCNPERKEKSPGWECKEKPLPSFNHCLQELTAVKQFLAIDHSKIDETIVKSVSIQFDAGSPISAIVGLTLKIKEKDGGGAWNVVSKKILFSDSPLMSSHVDNVITEAKKYLNYERAQGEFFEGDSGDPETKEETNEGKK